MTKQVLMKAAVYEEYGPPEVVNIKKVPKPVPADNEILIKVYATTVSVGDARIRALRVPKGLGLAVRLKFGLTKPEQPILGLDAAGVIEAVGRNVTQFKPGDRVVASRDFEFGCHAEYITVPQDGVIVAIPKVLSYQAAVSLCFGGVTALYFFRLGKLKRGESILINGASGAVGSMALQIAKHSGAKITTITSGKNAKLMKRLGADHTIDYAVTDFTSEPQLYDVIMDTHGNISYGQAKRQLKPGGRFLMVIGSLSQMIKSTGKKNVVSGTENYAQHGLKDFQELMSLAEKGALKPVIDTTLPFEEIVEAYRRVDSDHKVGSVVLSLE